MKDNIMRVVNYDSVFTKLEDKANLVDLAHVDRVCTNLEYTFREMGF